MSILDATKRCHNLGRGLVSCSIAVLLVRFTAIFSSYDRLLVPLNKNIRIVYLNKKVACSKSLMHSSDCPTRQQKLLSRLGL